MQNYPYNPPQQAYPQPPRYIPPVMTNEEYQTLRYQKGLRRAANGLGILMICFFALELLIALVSQFILYAHGLANDVLELDVLQMLESGMISSVVFFVTGLIYCCFRKLRFSSLFPFQKTGAKMLYRLCAVGIAFSLMSNYVVDLLNNNLGLFGIENNGGIFETGDNPNILMYFLTVAIIPAFVEEFAFRGVIMGVLRPYSEGLAIFVSSAAFALMHGNFVQLPFTFCCGLVFAYIDIKANSMLPSIIVHFLNNGLSVLSDILTSYKVISETTSNLIYGAIFVVTGVLAFLAIRGMIKEKESGWFSLKGGDDIIPFKRKMKTVCTSPFIISFAAVMLIYCVVVMVSGL